MNNEVKYHICKNCGIKIPMFQDLTFINEQRFDVKYECKICGVKLCLFCLRSSSGYSMVCKKHNILYEEYYKTIKTARYENRPLQFIKEKLKWFP